MNKILSHLIIIILLGLLNQEVFAYNTQNPYFGQYPALENANYFLLLDQDNGDVFLERNADVRIAPSSLTKLMTAYVVFDQIEKGKISLNNQCRIGKDAWKESGSKMFLKYD